MEEVCLRQLNGCLDKFVEFLCDKDCAQFLKNYLEFNRAYKLHEYALGLGADGALLTLGPSEMLRNMRAPFISGGTSLDVRFSDFSEFAEQILLMLGSSVVEFQDFVESFSAVRSDLDEVVYASLRNLTNPQNVVESVRFALPSLRLAALRLYVQIFEQIISTLIVISQRAAAAVDFSFNRAMSGACHKMVLANRDVACVLSASPPLCCPARLSKVELSTEKPLRQSAESQYTHQPVASAAVEAAALWGGVRAYDFVSRSLDADDMVYVTLGRGGHSSRMAYPIIAAHDDGYAVGDSDHRFVSDRLSKDESLCEKADRQCAVTQENHQQTTPVVDCSVETTMSDWSAGVRSGLPDAAAALDSRDNAVELVHVVDEVNGDYEPRVSLTDVDDCLFGEPQEELEYLFVSAKLSCGLPFDGLHLGPTLSLGSAQPHRNGVDVAVVANCVPTGRGAPFFSGLSFGRWVLCSIVGDSSTFWFCRDDRSFWQLGIANVRAFNVVESDVFDPGGLASFGPECNLDTRNESLTSRDWHFGTLGG
jgi:hypothetical protein